MDGDVSETNTNITFKANNGQKAVRGGCRKETHSQKTCKNTTHMKSKENK